METKRIAWQEQGPVVLPGELLGEEGTSLNSPPDGREAPRATPEEDLDDQEPGAEVREPRDHQPVRMGATQITNEKSAYVKQSLLRETWETMTGEIPPEVLPAKEESNNDLAEDVFPPPPTTDALSAGGCSEREGLSSLEGEVAEWISDAEVVLDPTDDLAQLDLQSGEEWAKTAQVVVQFKISQNQPSAEENVDENKTCLLMQPSHFDIHSADDANSPPFVDESGEEVGYDESGEVSQPSSHAASDPDSVLHAGLSAGQRGELLPQGPIELTPRGENQEAAQQVSGQGSLPLSAVAMEPSNQGREACQCCGCVVAVRERCSRVGEKTEGENEQTGGEEGQKDNGRNQPKERSSGEGQRKYQKPVHKQERKTGKQGCGVSSKDRRGTRMRNNMYEDHWRDSGESVDLYRTLEDSSNSTDSPATETPIEREIRRAIQREQSLRRSRGLPNPHTAPEYVEIPSRKGILSQSLTSKWSQNKDREFAGKMMQQEIHEETRREQDLVKIGKIPGFYDKGTVRQIKERKQLFEAFQTSLESTKSKMSSFKSTEDLTLEGLDDVKLQASMFRSLPVEKKPILLNPSHPKGAVEHSFVQGTGLSDRTGCQGIVLENKPTSLTQKQNQVRVETDLRSAHPHNSSYQAITEELEEEEEEEEDTSTENPFFKLRSSTNLEKMKQDILEAKERERELRKMRSSLYGGINGVASSSQRELSPPDVPESSFKEGRGSSAVRQSESRLSAWPPIQAEEQKIARPEVLLSPRTPRQKTPLVQLWESGLVNGHSPEDD
ncbi:putative LOC107382221-like protein [Nothobranchius furzeri]|uniref:LOC107382221-like protein n=3 Tax=Nothobranchius furzeri TaxID=105023 RepID=A0A9D2Y348_NOTFU|nr:putative LOC107382221-like protein [Nothobranchius furzeri]